MGDGRRNVRVFDGKTNTTCRPLICEYVQAESVRPTNLNCNGITTHLLPSLNSRHCLVALEYRAAVAQRMLWSDPVGII